MTHATIVPPYLLQALADHADDDYLSGCATSTLQKDQTWREQRTTPPEVQPPSPTGGTSQRTVSDAENGSELPGRAVRSEGDPATGDAAVDEAYDGMGAVYALFKEVYGRDSLDGNGHPRDATVHYERNYDNAFWDGQRLVFGDGDGQIFERFTKPLDVIAHEFAHGVTQHTAALVYQGQSGSLNESISDVFAALTVQRLLGQTADQASWLIGEGLFKPTVNGRALRSMEAPGTAYDDPRIGKDPQPATMSDFVDTTDDNGGVHINSGIPNRAFYLLSTALGGNAWETAGQVWFAALTDQRLTTDADFATFAGLTSAIAAEQHGDGSPAHQAVLEAWAGVEVQPAGSSPAGGDAPTDTPTGRVVRVRRTGGFAGLVTERQVDTASLDQG
ncbi:MAG: metalloprotease, partial [Propionibacteriales bacterium]|nr:metalloprotease [Propionibacteriales bacterium]